MRHQQLVDVNIFPFFVKKHAVLPWCYEDYLEGWNDSLVAFGHQDNFFHPPRFPNLGKLDDGFEGEKREQEIDGKQNGSIPGKRLQE